MKNFKGTPAYHYSIKTIWRRSTRTSASMGSINNGVGCVTKRLFVHNIISVLGKSGGGRICPP